MSKVKKNVIIKFESVSEQTVGEITRLVGLVKAKHMISIIDMLDLNANPRSSKTGIVTDAIDESIQNDHEIFPFKTKGILLASSCYELLERNRVRIMPENVEIEGILDGGHNTLAIGLFMLDKAMNNLGRSLPKGAKTWDEFKEIWIANRDILDAYLNTLTGDFDAPDNFCFLVPIELLVPRDVQVPQCVDSFKSSLLEICAARNNNVQLQVSAKANQRGYFDALQELMTKKNSSISDQIEWKTNDGGDIKVQDLIALAWIPLKLITPVKDQNTREIEPVSSQKIFSSKGGCLNQFEKLMSSLDVTTEPNEGYKRELNNTEVLSAFKITVDLPELYDYIFEMFPELYNAAGGNYGRITTVKKMNESRRVKTAPFTARPVNTLSPDGFIVPLVYGLQALMEKKYVDGHYEIQWKQDPVAFMKKYLGKIVQRYTGIFSMCDYDPQKIGKNPQSYVQALDAFNMALAGII